VVRPVFEAMKYVRLKTSDPYLNLAIEEYLFKYADDDIFMLWQNRPSVIIGKNQNAYAEVELEYAKDKAISVARRITGGGAVYHDGGNVNYSFITSRERADSLDFAFFTRPVIDALAELGLEASLSGRNDLICRERKLSGNAQFSDGKRVLHHGTLLFDTDLNEMSAVLKGGTEKLRARAINSHKSRVANIRELLDGKMSVEDFVSFLEKHVSKTADGILPLPENDARLSELVFRNRSDEWIYSHKAFLRRYSLRAENRFDFGTVIIELSLNGERIESALISGDFFEKRPISELEAILTDKTLKEVCELDPSPYIHGMSRKDMEILIKE